jgi:23S rRNA (adenine2503-C2)-methyltransferase
MAVVSRRFHSVDGTGRYLLQLSDGEVIESVLIPRAGRVTFCVSSQVGCSLACVFCLTGQLGLSRNLTSTEILSQVLVLQNEMRTGGFGERFSVVFMGMGEPLQNYDNVIDAIHALHDDHGLKLPMTRITVSTAGIIPAIERLAREPLFPNLSISLTGVNDATRNVLMPINRRYPIDRIVETVRKMPHPRQKRVMFESVMIKGVTDSCADAQEMARLLSGTCAKVNLIPLNPAEDIPFEPAAEQAILDYQKILIRNGIATFIRKNRGHDVSGACGQLKRRDLGLTGDADRS